MTHLVVGEFLCAMDPGHSGPCIPARMVAEGDPRYNLLQDLIEGDGPTQDAAQARLDALEAKRRGGRWRRLLCRLGLHDDGTDSFGGYSPTCLRCGGPS